MEGCAESVTSLGLGSASVSKTIAEFVRRISTIGNVQKRLSEVEEYVGRLEKEMEQIRLSEFPLCIFLLRDAVVYLNEVSRWCKQGEVEKSQLQEIDFMKHSEEGRCVEVEGDSHDKKSCISSFQLWSSSLNMTTAFTNQVINKVEVGKLKTSLGLETLGSKEDNGLKTLENELPVMELSLVPPAASMSVGKLGASDLSSSLVCGTAASGLTKVQLDSRKEMLMPHEHHYQQQKFCRKQRRCWSPELHKAFVSALQELGGPQVATPKQIRDLMRVDGLTNDEVKSHLQKYRLHIRRSPNKQMDSLTRQSTAVLGVSWNNKDHFTEFSKHSKDSESGSPPGPLELCVHHEHDVTYD